MAGLQQGAVAEGADRPGRKSRGAAKIGVKLNKLELLKLLSHVFADLLIFVFYY